MSNQGSQEEIHLCISHIVTTLGATLHFCFRAMDSMNVPKTMHTKMMIESVRQGLAQLDELHKQFNSLAGINPDELRD